MGKINLNTKFYQNLFIGVDGDSVGNIFVGLSNSMNMWKHVGEFNEMVILWDDNYRVKLIKFVSFQFKYCRS